MSITVKDLREVADRSNCFSGLDSISRFQCGELVQEIDRLIAEAADAAREEQIEWLAKEYPHLAQPVCGLLHHHRTKLKEKS